MGLDLCSCDTKKPYSECCEPVIRGLKIPEYAADVMRARYTAFVRHEIDFIMNSLSPARQKDTDRQTTEDWSKNTQWEGLEIVATEKGGPGDEAGQVEFIAKFREQEKAGQHHELATFHKLNGTWVFEDGRVPPVRTVKLEGPKIGRNDPCPCGSGKKYKKCHG